MRILGVDPGSRLTGYGCIDFLGKNITHVDHGTLKLQNSAMDLPLSQRLLELYQELDRIFLQFRPDVLAVERVFFAKNAASALSLGQARGVVLLSGAKHGAQVFEYSATEVKSVVVGKGRAGKEEVAHWVKTLMGSVSFETFDASDALAVAICHAFSSGSSYLPKKTKKRRLTLAEALADKIPR